MNKILDALGHYFLSFLVLIFIVSEELVWERFAQPIFRYIHSLKLLQKLEVYLQAVNGVVILFVFIVLFAITELQGIYAGVLFFKGKILLWALIYAGKIPIAAFTFWLFRVTKPKLMAFGWFKTSFDFLMRGIEWVKNTDTYKAIKTKSVEIKKYFKKNYMREGDSIKDKAQRIYRYLKVRVKQSLTR
jgi:hypothetical protein